jgi:hypothetical protein
MAKNINSQHRRLSAFIGGKNVFLWQPNKTKKATEVAFSGGANRGLIKLLVSL